MSGGVEGGMHLPQHGGQSWGGGVEGGGHNAHNAAGVTRGTPRSREMVLPSPLHWGGVAPDPVCNPKPWDCWVWELNPKP